MIAGVLEFLRSTKLFQGLEPSILSDLAAEIKAVSLRDGDVLVRQGDRSHCLYIVRSGRLRVSGRAAQSDSRVLLELETGDSTGEMCLFSSDDPSDMVEAVGESEVLELTRAAFARFAEIHPGAALRVTQALGQRLQKHRLAAALHLGPIFAGFDPGVLRDLESELELFTLYGGETLFRQGEPGDYLCFVISGHLRVSVRFGEGPSRDVAHLGPGEIVGEMALVSGEPRSSTVDAMRDTQLAKLSKEGYDRFVVEHPAWAVQLVSRKLAERLRDANAGGASRRPLRTIAVVPVHPSAPSGPCSQALASALAEFGSTVHVTSKDVDARLGQPGISQAFERGGASIRLSEWLHELEFENSYMIYEADPYPSPWTERAIRQADHVLLVADAAGSPEPGEIEIELLGAQENRPLARQWLVLVHPDGARPSGSRRWLDPRKVERHVHVRLGEQSGFERLARLVTGRAVGLTLGGGFARGLAHLGVFRAMAEMDIGIDLVGGASMGAMVGALQAMGWDSQRIREEVSAACADKFGDLTFPFVAFKTGRTFSSAVRKIFGEIQIEDLWTPYFCISANLNRAELQVHTRGSLAKAILAATRAPGVFPPVIYEGELHVDGGVVNNVPVDLMRPFSNDGIVVGVDVSPPHELHITPDYGDEISGWSAARKRWRNRSTDSSFMPSILLVMIRTLEFTGISYKNDRIKHADIYMYPDLLKFKRTDFHLASGIADAGYECAMASFRQWRDSQAARLRRPDLFGTALDRTVPAAAVGSSNP